MDFSLSAMAQDNSLDYMSIEEDRWNNFFHTLIGEGRRGAGVGEKAALRESGISKKHFLQMLARSREQREDDPPWVHAFAKAYDTAEAMQTDKLLSSALDRAINGTVEDVFHGDEVVGEKVKYDNNLTMKLLAARNPKYSPKAEVQHTHLIHDTSDILERLKNVVQMEKAASLGKDNVFDKGEVIDTEFEEVEGENNEL